MAQQRPIQWFHSLPDLIWPDGPFKDDVTVYRIPSDISFCVKDSIQYNCMLKIYPN
jgi:hypothetical protein